MSIREEPKTDPASDPQAGAGAPRPGDGLATLLARIPVGTCPSPNPRELRKALQRVVGVDNHSAEYLLKWEPRSRYDTK